MNSSNEVLSGRSLDALVAEKVMAIQVKNTSPCACGCEVKYDSTGKVIKRYSTDMAAAIEVEDRIAELGLQDEYAARLRDQVGTFDFPRDIWAIARATPEQRCRAALAAVSTQDPSGS